MAEAKFKVGDEVYCFECNVHAKIHTVYYDKGVDYYFYGILPDEDPSKEDQGHTDIELKKVEDANRSEGPGV